MAGGDLSERTLVTEQYLLDLEKGSVLILMHGKELLDRIQHMLKQEKPCGIMIYCKGQLCNSKHKLVYYKL